MSFIVPTIVDNPDGWGPVGQTEKLFDAPFAPFSKSDKLGKAADWLQTNRNYNKHQHYNAGAKNTAFDYKQEDDEDTFHLVDNKSGKPHPTYKKRVQWQPRPTAQKRRDLQLQQQQNTIKKGGKKGGQLKMTKFQKWNTSNQWHDRPNQKETRRLPSVTIGTDWELTQEFEFSKLKNLTSSAPVGKTLLQCGFVEPFDYDYTRVTPTSERTLERIERTQFNVTTSDDPVIRELAKEDKGTVFATDTILAVLMCATRSVLPWDIVVTKVGTKLFFDKRDNSPIDLVTVDETAAENPSDDSRETTNPNTLAQEATFINHNFSQQVLKKGSRQHFDKPNPFQSGEERVAAVGYAYRTWDMDDIKVVARCELDGVVPEQGASAFLTINALNEYNPRTAKDWRKTLETQRGAVLATELKNNGNKLARWTAEAILAGVDHMAIGFVSRQPRDQYVHKILGVQLYQLKEFIVQINLNTANLWGILKEIVSSCAELPNGKYLLLRDPVYAKLQLYRVPGENFEEVAK